MITRENYEIWFLDYAEGKLDPARQKLLLAFLEQNPDLKHELEAFDPIRLELPKEKPAGLHLKKKGSWLLEKYSQDELVFHYTEGNLNAEELREWNELVKTIPQLQQQAAQENQQRLQPQAHEAFNEKHLLKRHEENHTLTPANCSGYFIQYLETKDLALHKAITVFLQAHPQFKQDFERTLQLTLQPDERIVFEYKESLKQKDKVVAMYWWRYAAAAACIALAIWFFYPQDNTTPGFEAGTIDTTPQHPQLPGQNDVSPREVIAQQDEQEPANEQPVVKENNSPQNNPNRKNGRHTDPNEKENGANENVPVNIKKDQPNSNFAEEKHGPVIHKKDSVLVPANKHEEMPVANNQPKSLGNKADGVNSPLELVSTVINKKYYQDQTPREQTSSAFYAMRNVVHTVSGGEADMVKKDNDDYKEFSFKLGNFKFSRKKHKAGEEE